MKRYFMGAMLCLAAMPLSAGGFSFGIQAGLYSPTKSLDDNDNGLALGANIKFKLLNIALKADALYVDSSGRYESVLGQNVGAADLDVESILAADVMFYPLGGLLFLQVGVNLINIDTDGLDVEITDNDLGFEVGAGVTFLDKLVIQGKIMYTPDALDGDALDVVRGLDDEDLMGFLLTVGWNF